MPLAAAAAAAAAVRRRRRCGRKAGRLRWRCQWVALPVVSIGQRPS